MTEVELSAGSIRYEDSGGEGPEADLSLGGQVRLLAEFLERLELEEATLVFNDWCGAQLLVAEGWDGRVGAVGPGLL
jgi:hypothetical protein